MNKETYDEMVEKSKLKPDGIYSHKKNYYLVFNKRLHSYCDYFGNISECIYGFNVSKGKASDRFEGRDILRGYMKQLKTNP